jgi:uncharacterized membrane-anchored protein YjiN (DUF445 family)
MFKGSKHLARLSLAIMGTGFVATIPFQDSLFGAILQGGFEAGIVGGLADWFAVTALFRHPLGLPIPHTAILPKNRERMTKALVSIIENNWLTKESIQEKMKQIHFTEKLLMVIRNEIHSKSTRKGVQSLINYVVQQVNIEALVPFIENQLKAHLSTVKISPILKYLSDQALAQQYDEKAFDYLLIKTEEWLMIENRSDQLGKIALKALNDIELDGILQFAIKSFRSMINEETLGKILHNLLFKSIQNLQKTDNIQREVLLVKIRKELHGLNENKDLILKIDKFKSNLIDQWEPSETIKETLQKMKQKLLDTVQDGALLDKYLLPYVVRLLNNVQEDPAKINKIEALVQKQITLLIESNHSKIGKLVQENLDKLDNESLIYMMENNIGKDLQWIRVNGAVCGFIIGIIITVFKSFF